MTGDVYQHCKGGLYEVLFEGLKLDLNLSLRDVLEDFEYRILPFEARLESDKSEMLVVWDMLLNAPFLIYQHIPNPSPEIPAGLRFLVYHGIETGLTWVRSEPDFFSLHSSGKPRFSPL